MRRPLLLDLFCGAGGAAMGYHRAGFDIVGVDIAPQPEYPFDFVRADAVTYPLLLTGVVAIHASPPCQAHTTMSNRHRGKGGEADQHTDYIAAVRWRLVHSGLPYVIENVPGARRELHDPVTLSGGMFGLGVERPRLFEVNWPLTEPAYVKVANPIGVYGKHHDGRLLWRRKDGSEQRAAKSLAEARAAMGMPWASWRGVAEAIPPAYTEFIGRQLMTVLEAAA